MTHSDTPILLSERAALMRRYSAGIINKADSLRLLRLTQTLDARTIARDPYLV